MQTIAHAIQGRYRLVRGSPTEPSRDVTDEQDLQSTSALTNHQRLRERAEVIARTVLSQQAFYASQDCTDNQRQLVETMVGAAIWYLPQGAELWTGFLSEDCLRALAQAENPRSVRLTKEHQFPRKLAAAELLAIDWGTIADPTDEVLRRYQQIYGRFNYVLPEENKRLVRFQKGQRFVSPEQAYAEAGIRLMQVSAPLLKAIQAGDRELAILVLQGNVV